MRIGRPHSWIVSSKAARAFRSPLALGLVSCAVVFVCFSTVMFAMAIPGVVTPGGDAQETASATDGSDDAYLSSANGTAATALAGGQAADATSGFSLSSLVVQSPTFSSFKAASEGGDVTADTAALTGATSPPPENSPSAMSPSDGSSSESPSEEELDAETEEAIHAYVADKMAKYPAIYQEICLGWSNLFASLESDDPLVVADCSPVNARSLLERADAVRCDMSLLAPAGLNYIPGKSKWSQAANQVSKLGEHLVNAASSLDMVRGWRGDDARQQMAPHLSNGKVIYLTEFEQLYNTVRY